MSLLKMLLLSAITQFLFYNSCLANVVFSSCESSLNSSEFSQKTYADSFTLYSIYAEDSEAWQRLFLDLENTKDPYVLEHISSFFDARFLSQNTIQKRIQGLQGRLKLQRPQSALSSLLLAIRHPVAKLRAKSNSKLYMRSGYRPKTRLETAKWVWRLALGLRKISFATSFLMSWRGGPSTLLGKAWADNLPGMSPPEHWGNFELSGADIGDKALANFFLEDPEHYSTQLKNVWQNYDQFLNQLYEVLVAQVPGFRKWEKTLFFDFHAKQKYRKSDYERGPSLRRWYWQNFLRVVITVGLVNTLPHAPEAIMNADEHFKKGVELLKSAKKLNTDPKLKQNFQINLAKRVREREQELLGELEAIKSKLLLDGVPESEINKEKSYSKIKKLLDDVRQRYAAYL